MHLENLAANEKKKTKDAVAKPSAKAKRKARHLKIETKKVAFENFQVSEFHSLIANVL
jgi:hypothetical protein